LERKISRFSSVARTYDEGAGNFSDHDSQIL
jgi:hypothetical protein